ncbi:recombinase family protein [Sphingorhabdus sp.]|jgi:DNA invertase Pin-like site-specific DNA recombinase|uniref:recombinase family protein n=1 Tax=Sphingorhabdus sp. TaxID=1902408 RepID=UPI0037C8D984
MTEAKTKFRCAIYTRKSTDEGLEQNFNSLDAQRAACEAYIQSQAGEGWECLPQVYDDGGWSGGNMERPALKQLLGEISKGQVDIVVVYKVDRLTRSLTDFARIVETFDNNNASFVSVTQAFNTTNSMGRLTLNVLLSFAQFEREVTGERIRDKIAASMARGIWMGGSIPKGYDLGDRKLNVNPVEAEQVRYIFKRYLELNSLISLAKDLAQNNIRSKRWTARSGKERGGYLYDPSGLSYLLRNRIYLGQITHKDKSYPGEHDAIIEADLFQQVQERLAANHHKFVNRQTRSAACPLHNKIFDAQGKPMRPNFGYGRGKKIYRYYVSDTLLPLGRLKAGSTTPLGDRLSAERTERFLQDRLVSLLPLGIATSEIFDAIKRVMFSSNKLTVTLEVAALIDTNACEDTLLAKAQQIDLAAKIHDDDLVLSLDARPVRRGKSVRSTDSFLDAPEQKRVLAELVRTSHRKLTELNASPLHPEMHEHMSTPVNEWTRERIAIGLLAPDIQKALLTGTAPLGLDPEKLLSRDIPLDWEGQRKFLGMKHAA